MKRLLISGTKGSGERGTNRFPFFWIALFSGMASLLVVVGVLQFRWTKELSKAAEARIGNTLQPLMLGWHLDFYGELSAICVGLQVGPDAGARDNWSDYLHRYIDWRHGSRENYYANPALIKNIYIWETSDLTVGRLHRLNAEASKIESSAIPKELEPLFARLQAKSGNLATGLRAWELLASPADSGLKNNRRLPPTGLQRSDIITGWQFDKEVPAIVHPVVDNGEVTRPTTTLNRTRQNPVDWIVVVLNLDYIQKRILPTLTTRYFNGSEGLEYKLAVVDAGSSRRVIYSTDPGFPDSRDDAVDSRMNIFGPPPESVEGHFWQTIKNGETSEWRNFSAPVWFPVIQYASQDDPWVLLLEHRAGPLEAIATSIWHRDLITGIAVLLLLAVGMALIFFTSRRAHKLAKLQLDFVASISHELLTPLAAIYCTGQNVTDGLVQTRTDMVSHGSIITSQARQLTDLVKQILLFASTENGTSRYTLRPLQVMGILQSVRNNVGILFEGTGFNIEERVDAGLPCVMGDLPALTQCVQNLVSNAVKYSGNNRWIGISASVQDGKNHQREVQIRVQDRGPGISPSDLPHIFEPFYRSPDVVSAQIHGTGLGLAVAKRIAEAMGGRLTVTTTVGQGSTFTLHLPVTMRSEAETPEFAAEST